MSISRRNFLQSSGALVAASQLNACDLFRKKPKPICPFDPRFTDTESLLAIDVHSHVFNATDLQVKNYIRKVATRQSGGLGLLAQALGGLLQSIAWAAAPDVDAEARQLASLKPAILNCETEANLESLQSLRQTKYSAARSELSAAAGVQMQERALSASDLSVEFAALPAESQGLKQILELPETYDELFADPAPPEAPSLEFIQEVSIKSAVRFVIEMFQYRFVSVYNYLDMYNSNRDLKIDLLVPALVDFDWWLGQGSPTRSPLPQQAALMKEISILSGGRVHAFVSFDPYRQVVHDLGMDSGFNPLALVKTSVNEYGAMGVKLYPPMGFAPFGNAALGSANRQLWKNKNWLTDVARRDDFPQLLDSSLQQLYEFCAEQGVPVMGHSNESNGPSDDFEALTGPTHWQTAAAQFGDVSFSFGHFGGVGSADDPDHSNFQGFLDLMAADQVAGTQRLHADASYFSNVLDRPTALTDALKFIYEFGPDRPAVGRMMYGADWKMLIAESGASDYLNDFDSVISALEQKLGPDVRLKAKFFGQNAADFLGLRRNQDSRVRLENFYDANDFRTAPLWMTKVDEQA